MTGQKFIVGLGGALRAGSSTEAALDRVLYYARERGAKTALFSGEKLNLPLYAPGNTSPAPAVAELVAALCCADGIVLGSPSYHGGISGTVKNAIDYAEEMPKDPAPYFTNKPVGCVTTGMGWQGCNATLHSLRSIVHALRGWPTPLGIAINTATPAFDRDGKCASPDFDASFAIMADELLSFGAR